MSKNRNRAKLDKANDNREYRRKFLQYEYPTYSEYDWTWKHGDFPNHKWRSYKTWKYNRKNKWK
jgi:hypothetical protein